MSDECNDSRSAAPGSHQDRRGCLTVVGTGIMAWAHLTEEALNAIRRAEKVHHAVADTMMRARLRELNPTAERLPDYLPGRPRLETYDLWTDIVLGSVRAGLRTCAVAYGHPGVFVRFTRDAIRRAREEGFDAVMLPGISSEACLLCDLLVDPGPLGWQSYGATKFLQRRPRFDTGTPLVLWQIKVINQPGPPGEIDRAALGRLAALLIEHYGREHEVIVYEASRNPAIEPVKQTVPLARLAEIRIRVSATLYVPPLER